MPRATSPQARPRLPPRGRVNEHGCARSTSVRGCTDWLSLRPRPRSCWVRWRPISEALAAEWLTPPTAGNARADFAEVVLHSSGRGIRVSAVSGQKGQEACGPNSRAIGPELSSAEPSMGFLTAVTQGLVRGADRMSKWTSKRGPRTFIKSRGAKRTGIYASSGKFVLVKEMVPEFVVPDLTGFKLKPYVNYRVPEGTDTPLTAKALFLETAAPAIEKDFKEGTFDPNNLEKYGFEPTQEGKLFQLYPKNFPR